MPLLPPEPAIYPEKLLEGAMPANSWWVLHTKPRSEKSLARKLHIQNLHFYLPLYEKQLRDAVRVRTSYLPLFPGYVFLNGDDDARRHALETNMVVRTLPVTFQEELHQDLVRVHTLLGTCAGALPEDILPIGAPVEITHGPMAGLQGKLIKRGKNLKFFLEVRFLQQGVSVEIESWMVKPVNLISRGPATVRE